MQTNKSPNTRIWQVSELNHTAKALLEKHLGIITVCGEIASFIKARSGHWYFNLKDKEGQVRCAMFRNRNQHCEFIPKEGDLIYLQAQVSLYTDRGEYQLIGQAITPAGEGKLQLAFLQLKQRLQNEGLFDAQHKRPLPKACQRVAVITSTDGAAAHDFMAVAKQRMPSLRIDLIPVTVQGTEAAHQACQAIQWCNHLALHDVIVLTRGGGSMEDLWSFNDETLARTIANSQIIVVSAVGHETDFTIADFVADLRAPTPSAAAQQVTQDQQHLQQQLEQYKRQLSRLIHTYIQHQHQRISIKSAKLRSPQDQLQYMHQKLDRNTMQLIQSYKDNLHRLGNRLALPTQKLNDHTPTQRIRLLTQIVSGLYQRLLTTAPMQITSKKNQVANMAALLDSLSPLQTLARGYSIVFDEHKHVISRASQVSLQQNLTVRFEDGDIKVTVQ